MTNQSLMSLTQAYCFLRYFYYCNQQAIALLIIEPIYTIQ
ncbi:hypothetical protein FDUTEX481_03722 [Tolypothrix sp. PCC 7601]|nr:hypothetical protein FDUTEX481_03722 [Tolypothrix sp. PCC 7601]